MGDKQPAESAVKPETAQPPQIKVDRPEKAEEIVVDVEPDDPDDESPGTHLFKAFSWTKDDDDEEMRFMLPESSDTACGRCLIGYRKLPYLLRYVLYSIAGSAVFMIPGLISYFLFIGIAYHRINSV